MNEIQYLWIFSESGNSLKFNTDVNKRRLIFHRTMVSILSEGGHKPDMVIPLCEVYCSPEKLYLSEVLLPNISQKTSLDSPVKRIFHKLFNSSEACVTDQCHYYMS